MTLPEPRFRPAGRAALVHSGNGCEHVLVVTEEGKLHACGCNASGQLGHGEVGTGYSTPRAVGHLAGYRVAKVACSFSHTVIVTDDDQTWTFGGNTFGQLGHGDRSGRSAPSALACFEGSGVLSVACGLYHTVSPPPVDVGSKKKVVSVADGGLFSFGKNDHGQLGLESGEPRLAPERHRTCTAVVEHLACGYHHTVALVASGENATRKAERGHGGSLGRDEKQWMQGGQVPGLVGKAIIQVACGSYHTILLDAEGRVYPFGRNNHGQLGTGTREDSCRPCFVEELSDKFVCQVAAGFYHTLCLTGPALAPRGRGENASAAGSAAGARGSKSLSSDLYRLLNNPCRSDVKFSVEGKVIHGHRWHMCTLNLKKRCIIGARCEPLERMLDGPMREAWDLGGSIPLPNYRHAVFLAFLEYLYTDKVVALGADFLDLEFCLDLMELSDQYLVESLKRLCEDAIMRNITVENACELLVTAEARLAVSLRNKCFDFVVRNAGLVSSTPGIGNLSPALRTEIEAAARANAACAEPAF
ncbi:unnamed protein product [Scytosiphon promiscuus]